MMEGFIGYYSGVTRDAAMQVNTDFELLICSKSITSMRASLTINFYR